MKWETGMAVVLFIKEKELKESLRNEHLLSCAINS
jgi:hypothetical protein